MSKIYTEKEMIEMNRVMTIKMIDVVREGVNGLLDEIANTVNKVSDDFKIKFDEINNSKN